MKPGFLLLAALVVVLWVVSTHAEEEPLPSATQDAPLAGPFDPQSLNDAEIIARLTDLGRKLLQDKKLLASADIAPQMKAAKASINLPKIHSETLKPEDVYAKCSASVLIVAALHDKPQLHVHPASGFVITASGIAVTNYHVMAVTNMAGFVAMTRDGQVHAVTSVLAADETLDVALIQLDGQGFTPLAIAQHASIGADAFVISNPSGHFWSFARGIVARYGSIHRKTSTVDCLQITADYARGSSGGPVLSATGEVVGMVASTSSIYYKTDKDTQKDLQMVFKNCVTSRQILSLIEK